MDIESINWQIIQHEENGMMITQQQWTTKFTTVFCTMGCMMHQWRKTPVSGVLSVWCRSRNNGTHNAMSKSGSASNQRLQYLQAKDTLKGVRNGPSNHGRSE